MTDDEPAFPTEQVTRHVGAPGMSLRDWFAGQALVGICIGEGSSSWEQDAKNAYVVADAMLAVRDAK